MWIDDALAVVVNVISAISKQSRPNMDVARQCFKLALSFCFEKAVTHNGVTFTKWTELRKELRLMLMKSHVFSAAVGSSSDTLAEAHVATSQPI